MDDIKLQKAVNEAREVIRALRADLSDSETPTEDDINEHLIDVAAQFGVDPADLAQAFRKPSETQP